MVTICIDYTKLPKLLKQKHTKRNIKPKTWEALSQFNNHKKKQKQKQKKKTITFFQSSPRIWGSIIAINIRENFAYLLLLMLSPEIWRSRKTIQKTQNSVSLNYVYSQVISVKVTVWPKQLTPHLVFCLPPQILISKELGLR